MMHAQIMYLVNRIVVHGHDLDTSIYVVVRSCSWHHAALSEAGFERRRIGDLSGQPVVSL